MFFVVPYCSLAVMLRFGTWPTLIVDTSFSDLTSTTLTEFEPALATYTDLLSGLKVSQF